MRSHSHAPWVVVSLAFAVPLAFSWFTQHAWEDYFITLRSSRNLVEGHGLVFNPGERVHTFTSPLGVLVPALCTALAGAGNEQLALWLFRLINAALLAAGAALAWRRFSTLQIGTAGRAVFFGLVLADAKLTDFSTNGMETAILVFFVLLLWSALEAPEKLSPIRCGIGCAGLLWTRPDACILAAALILPQLLLRSNEPGTGNVPWKALAQGVLIGGVLYVPWFAWAWWYYGSPIPHTIIAKSLVTPAVDWRTLLLTPWHTLTGTSKLVDLFLPTYWLWGGWPASLRIFGHLLAAFAAFAWLIPGLHRAARRASLTVFIGMFYLCGIILFPWYSPPWMVVAALAIAMAADQAIARAAAAGRGTLVSAVRIAAATAVCVQVALLLATAWQMRVQQRIVETSVRRSIGEWLHVNATPGDTVFLEPLGYIGYFSRLKMYDYPGLSAPEVAAVIRSGQRRFTEVIERLQPTWVVLRPFEVADPTRPENAAWKDYQLVRTWNVRGELDAIPFLPGRPWLENDSEFRVFRRIADGSQPASAPAPVAQ